MKLCCVFNYNPLYRWPIFHAMDEVFGCDFYFGDTVFQKIERFDPTQLSGFQQLIISKKVGKQGFVWHKGIRSIFSKRYTHYLITGSTGYFVNWLILIYAKLTKRKLYYWTHGIHSPILSRRSRIINTLFYKNADGIFLYGRYAIPYMISIGCEEEKLHIIHNSLNTTLQSSIYDIISKSDLYTSHFGNNNPTAIYIGRIQKRKKIDELLRALAICREKSHEVNLAIIGPYEDDESIIQLTSDLGLDNQVWYYGPCYDEKSIAELLYNADVSVCPAAVGLSCIHSLSYGTPVITNNDFVNQMPEFEAIQEGITGSFFEKESIHDLADKIIFWTSRSDSEKRHTREIARQEILERWSVHYQINVLKSVLI